MVRALLNNLKDKFQMNSQDMIEEEENYVELSTGGGPSLNSKITVRPYVLDDFTDIKPIVDALREGYTIALINIGPLKEKDLVELKRAVNKLKKTIDAIEGDIAGFGDDYIVAAPSFAEVFRAPSSKADQEL